jgi:hypothetical protein
MTNPEVSYISFQMDEDVSHRGHREHREISISSVPSVRSVAIHPYENRCSNLNARINQLEVHISKLG